MKIIGINAFHADSSACLVIDGKLISAVEEERFNRIKHWAGFPIKSIKYCLEQSNLNISDIDHISINIDFCIYQDMCHLKVYFYPSGKMMGGRLL